MTTLSMVSEAVRELVAAAQASVVSVLGPQHCAASGVVVASDLLVTSAHGVERGETVEVAAVGKRLRAECLGVHARADLAVLRVDDELPLIAQANSPLALGEFVVALGRSGERSSARPGFVSSVFGEWKLSGAAAVHRYVETDIAAVSGLAGSALLNAHGDLVGINSLALARGALVALPIGGVLRVVELIRERGRVSRGHLGVGLQPVRLPRPLAERLGREFGLIVLSVQPASPAERAGVLLGDVMLAFGGDPLSRVDDLEGLLGGDSVGVERELSLLRAGTELQLSVKPDEKG